MASVYKRGKTYTANVLINVDGHRRRKTKSGFRTKAEANAWAIDIEKNKKDGKVSLSPDQLLSEYFHEWYVTYKTENSPATQKWYGSVERYINSILPTMTLKEFDRPNAQYLLNQLGQRYSTETVRKTRSILHDAIKSAMYDELIFKDPMIGVSATGKDGKDKQLKFLEADEMKRLVDAIQSQPVEERSYSDMMILLALNTGARYEEIAGLGWQDIKPGKIVINKAWEQMIRELKNTKTKSSNRIVDVPEVITDDLTAWKSYLVASDFVFGQGRPITSAAANKRLKALLLEINATKLITFHGLRHTHASWLISQGVDIQYVSARLGHKSVSMTLNVYTHMLDQTRKSEAEKSVAFLENL
jgi:integrase